MKKIIVIIIAASITAFAAACSGNSNNNQPNANATTAVTNNTSGTNTAATASHNTDPAKAGGDIPASVRAALPDAQSITKQHKDISPAQSAAIQQETGSKVPDTDHHSYLAFSNSSGTRQQIGAATVVKSNGKEMVIVYENREGKPYIKEVRAEGVPQAFLEQFKGKGHDDKFQINQDLKAQGLDDAAAKAWAEAVRVDIMTMQTLYGAPDKH